MQFGHLGIRTALTLIIYFRPTTAITDRSCGETFTTTINAYDESVALNLTASDVVEVHLTFSSCSMGYVSLSADPYFPSDFNSAYELWISNTAGVSLYQCHGCATNNLLDYSALPVALDPSQCLTTTSSYWLTWDSDTLVVGWGGTVGDNPLVSTEPMLHDILYLGFRSQPGAAVTWAVLSTDCQVVTTTSNSTATSPTVTSTTASPSAGIRYNMWQRKGVDLLGTGFLYATLGDTVTSRSHMDCARKCGAEGWCHAFAYLDNTSSCQLLTGTATNRTTSLQWIYVPVSVHV